MQPNNELLKASNRGDIIWHEKGLVVSILLTLGIRDPCNLGSKGAVKFPNRAQVNKQSKESEKKKQLASHIFQMPASYMIELEVLEVSP